VKLSGVEIHNSLLNGLVEYLEIDLQAKCGGQVEALRVVADEQAAHGQSAICPVPTTVNT